MASAAEFRTQLWSLQMSVVSDTINGLRDVSFRLHGKVLGLFKHPSDLFVSSQALPNGGLNPQEAWNCPVYLDITPVHIFPFKLKHCDSHIRGFYKIDHLLSIPMKKFP